MDQELLQKYISNPDRYCNSPDEIEFGEFYDFMYDDAYPFSYVRIPGTEQKELFFGKPGTSHDKIRDSIISSFRKQTNNNFTALDRLFGGYMRKEYVEQMKRQKASQEECFERAIRYGGREWLEDHEQNGRYFLITDEDINVCIFAFWNVYKLGDDDEDYLEPNSPDIAELVKMIMEQDQRIGQCDLILIANNEEPYYVYEEDIPEDFFQIGDNSAQRAIHLANQQQKRDFFADFRATRDKKIADKLTDPETGREMPLAQWNALRYVDESIEYTSIPEELKNIREWQNNPDKICLATSKQERLISGDNLYVWNSQNARPITYLTYNNENKLFIGKPGESHNSIKRISVREYFDEYLGVYAWSEYYSFISHPTRVNMEKFNIDGRVWTNIRLKSTPGKIFTIFTFWEIDKSVATKLVEMAVDEMNLSNTDVYIANGKGPYILFRAGSPIDTELQDNSQEHAIHLANQQQKRDFFADFRATRDRMIGQKLTMSNGQEMPMAQYNALRYVDESKNGPKRIFITESQFNHYLTKRRKK